VSSTDEQQRAPHGRYLFLLSLAAIGVVYGDIGTSPLYAIRECFHGPHAIPPLRNNVLGILSLIFWSLIIIITIKYLALVMRADNRGEGGIMALLALIPAGEKRSARRRLLFATAIFGAALLYGDGIITPAISVLSAVEGLEVATPLLEPYVLPITIGILIGLFAVQRRGTAGIGAIFGPLTSLWFIAIAILGFSHILRAPEVLQAVNPNYAVAFFIQNGWMGFLALGAVFLVVTGGEALYADMGHFGRLPIRLGWFVIVLPALLLNYFGQGALLLRNPDAVSHPFFNMAPRWALYPLVALATMATSIASQAVISGAFSLTRQAILLGFSPRLEIHHTSAREIGQIYVPVVNWVLMLATIGLVVGFRSSTQLAAAYGVAVTTTMVITTMLLYVVARQRWKWSRLLAGTVCGVFLMIDFAFFAANIIKIEHGGWFPLLIAAIIFVLMTTWRQGRHVLNERLRSDALPIDVFLNSIALRPPVRVPGTAVFMYRNAAGIPTALLHSLKHYKVLHERVVLLSVATEEIPHVDEDQRVQLEVMGGGIYRIVVRYGFMEDPDIPATLDRLAARGLEFKPLETTYFLGRETVITRKSGVSSWRNRLFASMARNATSASMFFHLPPNRVVELGAQIEL
jgi:KUP system potassium uptake protein